MELLSGPFAKALCHIVGGWTEEDRKGIRIMTRLAPCFEEELMDCWKTCFRTTTKQKSFKEALADYYNCRIKGHTNKLKCMLTGLQLPYDFLAAAHIWKKAKGGSGMFELFRLKPSDADDPRNGLLLARRIEEAFDRKDVCFLYSPPKQQLTLYVVNMDGNTATRRNPLRTTTVAQVKGWKSDQKKLAPTFEDLHGRPLLLPDGILIPFRRILSLHAKFAFQYGKNNGFISQEEFEQFETYSRVSDDAILREASSNL